MLEGRVTRLEEVVREVKGILSRLEPIIIDLARDVARRSDIERLDARSEKIELRLADTREEVKELKGAVSRAPTISHLLAATISTWIAGAGIVFLVMRSLP